MLPREPDRFPWKHGNVSPGNEPDLVAWREAGFAEDEATAWIAAASGRFTPYTAQAWRREGFGPADAALWSEVYADPAAARARRSAGYADPWDWEC